MSDTEAVTTLDPVFSHKVEFPTTGITNVLGIRRKGEVLFSESTGILAWFKEGANDTEGKATTAKLLRQGAEASVKIAGLSGLLGISPFLLAQGALKVTSASVYAQAKLPGPCVTVNGTNIHPTKGGGAGAEQTVKLFFVGCGPAGPPEDLKSKINLYLLLQKRKAAAEGPSASAEKTASGGEDLAWFSAAIDAAVKREGVVVDTTIYIDKKPIKGIEAVHASLQDFVVWAKQNGKYDQAGIEGAFAGDYDEVTELCGMICMKGAEIRTGMDGHN